MKIFILRKNINKEDTMKKYVNIPEILQITSIENLLINNKNIPEQLMINEYAGIMKTRKSLFDRMNYMRIMKKVNRDTVQSLMEEERTVFARFLCNVLTQYKIQQHNIEPFLNDFYSIFDALPQSLGNMQLKADTIEYVLSNQRLSKEQIDRLDNELRRIEDFIIEEEYMVAGA